MKRYHQLGFIVKDGRCKIAYYDVLENQCDVVPSLDFKAIEETECTSAENETLQMRWKTFTRKETDKCHETKLTDSNC